MDKNEAKINEIFSSIQGEGLYIGCRQIFVRFSGCNMACDYCDTDHSPIKNYSTKELLSEIEDLNRIPHHSVSLTGGEPLLQAEFLSGLLPELERIKVYLETNGTLPEELEKIINYSDIIAMDIKLESATGAVMPTQAHSEFIKIARSYKKEIFAKVVFSKNITNNEISTVSKTLKNQDITLVLQPMNNNCEPESIISTQNKFLKYLPDVRVIPQTHKYLSLR